MKNQLVNHRIYGAGIIRALEGEYITVEFGNHIKKTFCYPDCFDGYMEFEDVNLQEIALNTAKEKQDKQRKLRDDRIKATVTKINALKHEQEIKKIKSAGLKDVIAHYVGCDNYKQFMYVRKQLRKFGNLSKIMSREYIADHPYIVKNLYKIKCNESPEEILYFYRHDICDGYGDMDLWNEICPTLTPDGTFFSKAAKERFIRALAEFNPEKSDEYCGMAQEVFENAWNDLIAFCCQLLGNSFRRKKDYISAFKYYKKESDIYGVGTPRLGDCYVNGWGTDRNIGKALACYFKEEFAPEQYTCNYPADGYAPKACSQKQVFKAANAVADEMKGDQVFCYYFAKMLFEGFGTKIDLKRAEEFALQTKTLNDEDESEELELGSDAYSVGGLLEEISNEKARRFCLDIEKSRELNMDVYKNLFKLDIKQMESNNGIELIGFQFYPRENQPIDAIYYPKTSSFKTDHKSNEFSLTDNALVMFQDALKAFDYRSIIDDAEKCQNGFNKVGDKDFTGKICWRNTGRIAVNQSNLDSGFIYQFYIKRGPETFEVQEGTLWSCSAITETLEFGLDVMSDAKRIFQAEKVKDRYLELGLKWVARIATDEELVELGKIDGIEKSHFRVLG